MPTTKARHFNQSVVRRAALLVLAVALVSTLVSLITTNKVSACGPPPRPLRTLFLESNLIVVAHVGDTIPLEVVNYEDASYQSYLMKTALRVSSIVKGESAEKTIYVYHQVYVSDGKQPEQHAYSDYKADDKLLVFLQRREEGEGFSVADESYSIKKLSDDDLKIYLQRIDELASIMSVEQPDSARLVEWLVRCVEEPATRWDGAYELSYSHSLLMEDGKAEDESSEASTPETEEPEATEVSAKADATPAAESAPAADAESGEAGVSVDDSDNHAIVEQPAVETVLGKGFMLDSAEFARLLTPEQKGRLTAVLFSAKTIGYDENLLIELVKHWDEPRLVPFLLSYLHSVVDDPQYMAHGMMMVVAEVVNNKALTEEAQKYAEEASYDDSESERADNSSTHSAEMNETAAVATQEPIAVEQKAEGEGAKESTGNTNKQKRSAMLKNFLASAESVAPEQRLSKK